MVMKALNREYNDDQVKWWSFFRDRARVKEINERKAQRGDFDDESDDERAWLTDWMDEATEASPRQQQNSSNSQKRWRTEATSRCPALVGKVRRRLCWFLAEEIEARKVCYLPSYLSINHDQTRSPDDQGINNSSGGCVWTVALTHFGTITCRHHGCRHSGRKGLDLCFHQHILCHHLYGHRFLDSVLAGHRWHGTHHQVPKPRSMGSLFHPVPR